MGNCHTVGPNEALVVSGKGAAREVGPGVPEQARGGDRRAGPAKGCRVGGHGRCTACRGWVSSNSRTHLRPLIRETPVHPAVQAPAVGHPAAAPPPSAFLPVFIPSLLPSQGLPGVVRRHGLGVTHGSLGIPGGRGPVFPWNTVVWRVSSAQNWGWFGKL